MQTAKQQVPNTHRLTLNGETVECTIETFEATCDALVARHGGGRPTVDVILATTPGATIVDIDLARQAATRAAERPSNKARAVVDEMVAKANGFSPKDPVYAIGTAVNETGVENATRSQIEHEAKPRARQMCQKLSARVRAEKRYDLTPILPGMTRMNEAGLLALPASYGDHSRLPMTTRTFHALMTRMPCPSGTSYLDACPPKLRASNYNYWATRLHEDVQAQQREVVLRTRLVDGQRVVYAAVSPGYASFDADKIADALALAFPEDARGSLDYTGERLRIEGLWHTDVKPEDFVAGEFFKAGVIITSDDAGGGSLRVRSVLWRNLCLNLIILDQAIGVDVRIRHSGSVELLAAKFSQAFGEALNSIAPFRRAWGAARAEQGDALKQRVQGTTSEDLGSLPIEAVLPGIFAGIIKRDLVPVRGRVQDTVPRLLEMHRQDEAAQAYGVSRASIVNAFTRYAHVVETDPFHADEIRAGAGALLSGHRGRSPAPLPYVSDFLGAAA